MGLGASQVDYIDHCKSRLEVAAKLGANPIEIPKAVSSWYRKNAPRIKGRYLITVDASANVAGLNYAIRSLASGGICTSVGYYFQKCTCLPIMQMYINGSTFYTGISNPHADLPELLDLIKCGKFHPELVTSLVADWIDAPQAYLERGTKVVIKR